MISDKKLAKISLIVSIAGIIGIYLTTMLVGPEYTTISLISEEKVGNHVAVNATVVSFSNSNGNIFLILDDGTGNITAVVFERTARTQPEAYNIKKDDSVYVSGQVNVYKGELEIIVSSVIIWK